MSFIRTVLGDISPDDLGVTDCHDHLIRSGGEEVREHKSFLMDSVKAGTDEFLSFAKAGGKSMLCMDPIACGRNVPKMLELANNVKSSGNIIMVTGFHKAAFYDTRTHWLNTVKDIDKIVNLCALEIEEGMDNHSYNGPVIERSTAKAGGIKVGTGYANISDFEKKAIQVAALVQKRTGCPIITHTQLGTMGIEQVELFKSFGADLSHLILSHLQKNPDKYEHQRVIETGATICYDGPDRGKYYPDSTLADIIKWLCDKGLSSNIVLSMDAGRIEYQTSYMKEQGKGSVRGIKWLLTGFVPLLRNIGVSESDIENMLVNNPKRLLTFKD